jgi:hypothetical protein
VGFRVRPKAQPRGGRQLLRTIEVGQEALVVDENLRRGEIGEQHLVIG